MKSIFLTILPLLAAWLSGCGNNKIDTSASPQVQYFIESKYTSHLENTLVITGIGAEQLQFKLSGRGFTAEIPLDTEVPVRPRTLLKYAEVGDYTVNIQFFKTDGTPLLQDTVKWSFSLDSPENPIVGFASAASNDPQVVLLVSESRDPQTNEVWIEGDIAASEQPEGSWRRIPSTSKVPLRLSAGDGMKTLKVRLRNDFKNETDLRIVQVLLKTKAPTNCKVELRGSGSSSRYYEMLVSGDTDGSLYYRVTGDVVEPFGFVEFKASSRVLVKLKSNVGEKNFMLQIRDAAENFCLTQDIVVNYDTAYQSEGIRIKDNLSWTDSPVVTVQPWTDHLSDDTIEMFIHGDVVADDRTFKWIPWQNEIDVTLQPSEGHRWVRVQFRVSGELTNFRYAPIFLRPGILVQGTGAPYRVIPSDMMSLDKLSLTGCAETYDLVAFAAHYSCTPTGAVVQIQYNLKDGSSLLRSANIPP